MKIKVLLTAIAVLALITSCSTTKSIPEGDQLYTGLKPIEYQASEKGEHFIATQEELEAALATAPNGALFGSSSIRTPLPIGLWVWNEFVGSESFIGKWLLHSFGSKPVLMSWVNPELRASVATQVLRAHGYFRGKVTHEVLTQHNPKEAKIQYKVNMGHLFTIDTLRYLNFPLQADSLIQATKQDALVKSGDAFDVNTLEAERMRLTTLLRNNGYFYYQNSYASYLADTVSVPGKVRMKFQNANNIPSVASRQWYIGNIDVDLRKQFMETLADSVKRRSLTVHYNGKRPPLRTAVLLNAMSMRKGRLYSYTDYEESVARMNQTGLFSLVDFSFTPRDTTGLNDTIDLRVNGIFDRPYDVYFEGNLTGKTNNRFGPGVVLGLTRRNAFRGGELLDIKLKGNYEWQTGHKAEGTSSSFNSYEYGFDVSLQVPRLVVPFASTIRRKMRQNFRKKGFYDVPTTTFKASSDIVSRANFFKRHVVSGELTYQLQTSPTSRHEFSPLIFSFEYMRSSTAAFDSILQANPYLQYTMQDQFIPKMQYTYTYTSPKSYRNPVWWKTTISESGNLLSLGYMIAGNKWGTTDKRLFSNPYAQFVKLQTEVVKTWQLTEHSQLVGHLGGGVIWSYGNSSNAPYSEQFYVGGANSIRAFTVRSVGPGSYHNPSSSGIYFLDQTGDMQLLANLEYRPRLFGNLYGALFIDAGNVWELNGDSREGGKFKLKNLLKETALGTGVGLRYDLDFLVIRLDWGVGLHVPYKPGFYNVGKFSDSQSIHFAIGYPF
ncbi:MAG: BamA/TamA family outer membrane protein [Prevotella sp.]|nr:BamA/TamA family outer membrane protein [Prevotella sp.]